MNGKIVLLGGGATPPYSPKTPAFGPTLLAAAAIRGAQARLGLNLEEIQQVFLTGGDWHGFEKRQALAVARTAGLSADVTLVDRGESSAEQAFVLAAGLIAGGQQDLIALLTWPRPPHRAIPTKTSKARPGFSLFSREKKVWGDTTPDLSPSPNESTLRAWGVTAEAVVAFEGARAKETHQFSPVLFDSPFAVEDSKESNGTGALCVVLASEAWAKARGLAPLARLDAWTLGRGPEASLSALFHLKQFKKLKDFRGLGATWPDENGARFLLTLARARSRRYAQEAFGQDTALGFFDEITRTRGYSPDFGGGLLTAAQLAAQGKPAVAGSDSDEAFAVAALLSPVTTGHPPHFPPDLKSPEIFIRGDGPALTDLACRALVAGLPIRVKDFEGGRRALSAPRGPLAKATGGDPEKLASALVRMAVEAKMDGPRGVSLRFVSAEVTPISGDHILVDGFSQAVSDGPLGLQPRVNMWSLPGRSPVWEWCGPGNPPTEPGKSVGLLVLGTGRPVLSKMLTALAHESCHLVQEGVSPESIEKEMLAFGMAVGPLDLFDLMGPERVLESLARAWPTGVTSSPFLDLAARRGWKALGEKHAAGFYIHTPSGAKLPNPETALFVSECLGTFPVALRPMAAQTWRLRLLAAVYREAKEAVANHDLDAPTADALSVHGLGLPLSSGGILTWWEKQDPAVTNGAMAVVEHRRNLGAPGKVKTPGGHPGYRAKPVPRRGK